MNMLFSVNAITADDRRTKAVSGTLQQAEPALEVAIEMSRMLARAGLTAPEGSRTAASLIAEWSKDYLSQNQVLQGKDTHNAPEVMSDPERDQLHHYTFQRAREANWSSYDNVLAPTRSIQEQRIARVLEAHRYARLGAGFGAPTSVEMELLETEVIRHLCCDVLRILSRQQSLEAAELELQPAGSNYAELMHRGITLVFVNINSEERKHPALTLKIVIEALTREVSSYLCDEGLVNKAIEALRVQQESTHDVGQTGSAELHHSIRQASPANFCL